MHTETHPQMFTAASFVITKVKDKIPVNQGMMKLSYHIHTVKYYTAIKKEKVLSA